MNYILWIVTLWAPVAAAILLVWVAVSLRRIEPGGSTTTAAVSFGVFALGMALAAVFPPEFSVSATGMGEYVGVLPEGAHTVLFPVVTLFFVVGAGALGLAVARFSRTRT